ncbi:hypothetical protein ACWGI8_13320 [Streptomyces sp. NPDC054841]
MEQIDARERALTGEAEQAWARIDELATRLREFDQEIDHLRITTRKTLLSLAPVPVPVPVPVPGLFTQPRL